MYVKDDKIESGDPSIEIAGVDTRSEYRCPYCFRRMYELTSLVLINDDTFVLSSGSPWHFISHLPILCCGHCQFESGIAYRESLSGGIDIIRWAPDWKETLQSVGSAREGAKLTCPESKWRKYDGDMSALWSQWDSGEIDGTGYETLLQNTRSTRPERRSVIFPHGVGEYYGGELGAGVVVAQYAADLVDGLPHDVAIRVNVHVKKRAIFVHKVSDWPLGYETDDESQYGT